jgi:hypothetical protein
VTCNDRIGQRIKKPMYGWEESYKNAMLETDRSRLPERIEAAQTSINRRLQEINAGHDSKEERQAIRDALAGLNILRREVLPQAAD